MEHREFKAEAGVPHGATDDLFGACIGAMMALLTVPDASMIADAVRGQVRTKRDRERGGSVLYEPGGHGGILGERL